MQKNWLLRKTCVLRLVWLQCPLTLYDYKTCVPQVKLINAFQSSCNQNMNVVLAILKSIQMSFWLFEMQLIGVLKWFHLDTYNLNLDMHLYVSIRWRPVLVMGYSRYI